MRFDFHPLLAKVQLLKSPARPERCLQVFFYAKPGKTQGNRI